MRAGGSSRAMATGLIIVLLSVSAGINFVGSGDDGGGFGLLLSFAGVVAGVNAIAVGARLADDAAAPSIAGALALAAFPHRRRNLACFLGLVMVSSSACAAAVARETTDLAFCFGVLLLLLLGLSLINIGVLGA